MIILEDIKIGDIIRVLVLEDDLEEEMFARVIDKTLSTLEVRYLSETSKLYKGACVHAYENDIEIVTLESLTEHHDENPFEEIGENMYVLTEEIDEDDTSTIVDSEDDSDTDDSFVVADDVIDGEIHPPEGFREIDAAWQAWQPQTAGSRRFKQMVDAIEQHARQHADNVNF